MNMNMSITETTSHNSTGYHSDGQDTPPSAGLVSDESLRVVSIVFFVILCQPVDVFGAVSNVINMAVFSRIGYTDTIYISLTALAVCDFGVCFILIWHTIAMNPWFQELHLPFDPTDISYLVSSFPHVIFAKLTTMLTAFISFERCLCVTVPLKVKVIITRKVVIVFVAFTFVFGFLNFSLLYSTNWYDWTIFSDRNRSLIVLVVSENREEMEKINFPILYVFFPIFCFIVVTASTAMLVFALRKNSKWKRTATSVGVSGEKSQTVSLKEMKVARMVTMLSIMFIVCFIPHTVCMSAMTVDRSISMNGVNKNLLRVAGAVTFFPQSINSACNIFIYYTSSSAY